MAGPAVRRARTAPVVALVTCALLVMATGAAAASSSGPTPSSAVATGVTTDPSAAQAPVLPPSVPPVVLPPATGQAPSSPPVDDAALAQGVGAALASPAIGSSVTAGVLDVATGRPVMGRADTTALLPASTLKLLTAMAVLRAYGDDDRLRTTVVDGAGATQIVLVGAGDATLTRTPARTWPLGQAARPASLSVLATQTAAALRAAGRTSVSLAVDDSLFTGPRAAPGWPASYLASGVVAPVTALSVDQGRHGPGLGTGIRAADPSLGAGLQLAALLRAHGITVARTIVRATAPDTPTVLASVVSPTMADLVERMLTQSDDDLAEALGHLAGGRLGGAASFAGGAIAVEKTLADLGVPTAGLVVADGSGLSLHDRSSASTLTHALAAAVTDEPYAVPPGSTTSSVLWPVTTGLPVAGATGTLIDRFTVPRALAGRGVVRAKTGTLTGVNGLAGVVRASDGRLLAFAFVGAASPGPQPAARAALDRAATVVASAG